MDSRLASRRARRRRRGGSDVLAAGRGRSTLRAALRGERGGALVEVMMASLLVVMVATAVFRGIDGASATSGASKSRAVAASIAESDQERLRATPPADLVDYSNTATVTRGGIAYTVTSSVRWVADRDATPDCNTTTSRTGYLRILSRVSWPDMRGSQPIVASSLVAAPNGTVTSNLGAIGIRILNEANVGVAGVNVTVSGAGLSPKSTDASGCAYWDEVPQGNYSYTASKTGYVNYEGGSAITRPIGVAGGQTRIDTAYLDVATSMNVEVVTRRYGGAEVKASAPVPPGPADNKLAEVGGFPLHLANGKMAALNGVRTFPASEDATRTASGLYPMSYGVYLGPCARANNPATYVTPFEVAPPYPSVVRPSLPSINVRARIGGSYSATNGGVIKFTQLAVSGETCTKIYYRTLQNVPGVGDGALLRPEMPYGRYTVCGEAQVSGTWYKSQKTVDNTSRAGVDVLLDDYSATTGRC